MSKYQDQVTCKITGKKCRDLWLGQDQYGIQYGTCHKAGCLIWNVKECDGSNPKPKEKKDWR